MDKSLHLFHESSTPSNIRLFLSCQTHHMQLSGRSFREHAITGKLMTRSPSPLCITKPWMRFKTQLNIFFIPKSPIPSTSYAASLTESILAIRSHTIGLQSKYPSSFLGVSSLATMTLSLGSITYPKWSWLSTEPLMALDLVGLYCSSLNNILINICDLIKQDLCQPLQMLHLYI